MICFFLDTALNNINANIPKVECFLTIAGLFAGFISIIKDSDADGIPPSKKHWRNRINNFHEFVVFISWSSVCFLLSYLVFGTNVLIKIGTIGVFLSTFSIPLSLLFLFIVGIFWNFNNETLDAGGRSQSDIDALN